MTKKQYHNATGIFSTRLAMGSFAIGTLLLILYLAFKSTQLIQIGLIYVSIAAVANLIILFYLIFLGVTQKNHQAYYLIKILILLANIPIVFVYIQIVADNF